MHAVVEEKELATLSAEPSSEERRELLSGRLDEIKTQQVALASRVVVS